MKILMFGRTGQVATEIRRLGNVEALGREEADLADPEACAAHVASSAADVIINAAAYTAVDQAEKEEGLATTINGDTPTAMARAAATKNIPFLHLSTDYVFDGTGDAPWRPEDATNPLGAYGRSKLLGEQGICAAGGRFVILRTSWVFSTHGRNFVNTMLRLAGERDEVSVVSDQFGGPTAAADIAAVLLRIAESLHAGNGKAGIHHFSGAPDVSWADFASEIFRVTGTTTRVNPIASANYPTPAKRPANSRLDCRSLRDAFGIERPDWRAAVRAVLGELGVRGE